MLTADLPADAVPPTKTQVALDCCRLTYAFLGSITRRAVRDSVRSAHRLGGALARLFRGRLGLCPEQRVGVSFAHGAGGADRANVWRGGRADYL
jgi:hypothetical protein